MSGRTRFHRLLEILFPSAPDDLMAVANAAGVTATPTPAPVLLDTASPQYRAMVARRGAALRAATGEGLRDFSRWEVELAAADEIAVAEAEIDRRWFDQGGGA